MNPRYGWNVSEELGMWVTPPFEPEPMYEDKYLLSMEADIEGYEPDSEEYWDILLEIREHMEFISSSRDFNECLELDRELRARMLARGEVHVITYPLQEYLFDETMFSNYDRTYWC